jgi:hypothetical protein
MSEAAKIGPMQTEEQTSPNDGLSGRIFYPSNNDRPVFRVDLSQLSADFPENLTVSVKLGDNEKEEKREQDRRPPLIDDVSNEEKLNALFERLSKNPTEVDAVAEFLRQRDANSSFGEAAEAEPASGPCPADAPPLWAERTTGREVSPMDWVKMHYGNRNPENWEANGLKRSDLQHDKPLYLAIAKWLTRHPEDDFDPESRRTVIRYTDPVEAVARIRQQKRGYVIGSR